MLLPTLGKPTTATVGGRALTPGPRSRASSTTRVDDLGQGQAGGVDLDRVGGGAQGAVLAPGVAGVALALGGEHRPGSSPVCAARRRARSSSEAVRKTFSGESGLTTVPMSRPSAT